MTLGDKQRLFMRLVPRLLDYIHEQGYECTGGDLYRDKRAFGELGEAMVTADGKKVYGRKWSNHKQRLAIDLNLFKDGVYLTSTKDHRKFGEYWEQMHELCKWGGHYDDGNHYSLEDGGRQ